MNGKPFPQQLERCPICLKRNPCSKHNEEQQSRALQDPNY
jgi:hypothetical protein